MAKINKNELRLAENGNGIGQKYQTSVKIYRNLAEQPLGLEVWASGTESTARGS